MTKFNFSDQEWVACLKVLRALKENPFQNPDNQTFKTLITSIYKNAKKELRKQNIEDRRNKDQLTLQQSVIVSNALNNTTEYIAKEAKYEQEYTPLTTKRSC